MLNAALYLAARVLWRVTAGRMRLIRYYLVAQPVPATRNAKLSAASSVNIVLVRPDDALVAQSPRPTAVIARRFATGALCVAATARDRFAGYIWLQLAPYDEDEVRCRYVTLPAQSTSWDFDVYVDPAHRMGRVFVRLWETANELLRERGVTFTLSRISAFNAESLRSHERLGLRRIGVATFLCAGPVQLTLASLPPYVHISLHDSSRPELRLRAPA